MAAIYATSCFHHLTITYLDSVDALQLLLVSASLRAASLEPGELGMRAAWSELFERDVADWQELMTTVRWHVRFDFAHSRDEKRDAFSYPFNLALAVKPPLVSTWLELLTGRREDAAAELAAAAHCAPRLAAPEAAVALRDFAQPQLDPREWSPPTRLHNARMALVIAAERLPPALRVRNASRYLAKTRLVPVRTKSGARYAERRLTDDARIIQFAARYGLGGALLRTAARRQALMGDNDCGIDAMVPLSGRTERASTSRRVGRSRSRSRSTPLAVELPVYAIAAMLGHVDVLRRVLAAGAAIAPPLLTLRRAQTIQKGLACAGVVLAWAVLNNLPAVVVCLVARFGWRWEWMRHGSPLSAIARHLLCDSASHHSASAAHGGGFGGGGIALGGGGGGGDCDNVRWVTSVAYDPAAWSMASGAERGRERSRCAFVAKQAMLFTLARLGLPLVQLSPALALRSSCSRTTHRIGGGARRERDLDDSSRAAARSSTVATTFAASAVDEPVTSSGVVWCDAEDGLGLDRLGLDAAQRSEAIELVYDAVYAYNWNTPGAADLTVNQWRRHMHEVWAMEKEAGREGCLATL